MSEPPKTLLERLRPHLTQGRQERIDRVLDARTKNLTVILENLHDPFNISACLRTCEAFGLQYVQIIDPESRFEVARGVSRKSEKWLSVQRSDSPEVAVRFLADRGARLLVSSVDPGCGTLAEKDLSGDVALAFGNERDGISADLDRLAADRFHIPMPGFTPSVNVTVAVASSLQILFHSGWTRQPFSPEERLRLKLDWYRRSVSDRVRRELGIPDPPP